MLLPDKIEQYIDAKEHWRGELMYIRSLLLSKFQEETIKWGAPVYSKDNKNLVGISAFKNYVGLWFFQGGLLKDMDEKLVNAQEGKTKAMRQWRFSHMDEILENKKLILAYLDETIANHDAGEEIKPQKGKTKKPLIIPDELNRALKENKELNSHFENLSLSKKREYATYISEAKRNSTKQKRLEKIIPMIKEGKGLNDKYR